MLRGRRFAWMHTKFFLFADSPNILKLHIKEINYLQEMG